MSNTTIARHARLWKRPLSTYTDADASGRQLRGLTLHDARALGALLFDAFRGTIDDAGQTEAQYMAKANAIVSGQYGAWLAAASWTIEEAGSLTAACLVCDDTLYGCPVIAVVATRPSRKQSGHGGVLVDAALRSLAARHDNECCAMVTIGNEASEQLFRSRGFLPLNIS